MEYLRPGGSLFALAFRERDAVQELYRAVSAVSGRKETAGERLRIAAAGDDLCLEPEGEPGLVIGHWMNLRGEEGRLPWERLFPVEPFRERVSGLASFRYILFFGAADVPDVTEFPLGGAGLYSSVTAYNIARGHSRELLSLCRRLSDYGDFVETVKAELKTGEFPEIAVKRAVSRCRERGVLAELLTLRGREAAELVLREYRAETAMLRERQLGYAAGVTEGMARGEAYGMARMVSRLLERFGEVPEPVARMVEGERDRKTLKEWGVAASEAVSLEDFLCRAGCFLSSDPSGRK